MILLSNGCSWTWGGGLNLDGPEYDEQRESSVWPYHLAQKLNASEIVNLAAGNGSNARIIRTTFDWLLKQSNETLEKTIAIIQWTFAGRYEYYQPIAKEWARCNAYGCLQTDESDDTAMYRNLKRLETYSDQELSYELLNSYSALANIFKTFGVKYYYWGVVSNMASCNLEMIPYFNENFNWISKNNYEKSSNAFRWDCQRVSEQDFHPGFIGHKEIAKIIFDYINE